MEGVPVEEADCEKDLGVTFTTDLKTAAHCKDIYSKANRMLGLLSRTMKYKNPAVQVSCYRPHLQYCSAIWKSAYNKGKFLLERIQHRFTRIFPHLRPLPYETRLRQLGRWSLEARRNRADLIDRVSYCAFAIHSLVTFFSKRPKTLQRAHLEIGEEALSL